MFNLLIPGEHLARVKWTGKSVSINKRNMITKKKSPNGKLFPIIIKSPDYREFCNSIASMFGTLWNKPALDEQLFMVYYVGPHYWGGKKKDADAFHKPLQDGLHNGGVIRDDSQILGYCMLPLEPNPSMDYVQVDLYHMRDLNDCTVVANKERFENVLTIEE